MAKITDHEREHLTIGLAQLATKASAVQANLISKGHEAFIPTQHMLFEFVENSDEERELHNYLQELAKEALGAIRRPGTGIIGGDGFRSNHLEELRWRRDREIGNLDDYKRAPSGRWRFEINPVVRRFDQFKAEYPDDYGRRNELAHQATQCQMAKEAKDCSLGEFSNGFSDDSRMIDYLRLAHSTYLKNDGLAIGKGRLSELKPIAAFPLHEEWTVAIYINMPQHFLSSAANLTLIDQHTVLVKMTPKQAVGRQLTDKDDYHRLRLENTIYGFGAYRSARNLSEIGLAVKANSHLLYEFIEDVKAVVSTGAQST